MKHVSSCGKSTVDYLSLADLVTLCQKKGILPIYIGPERTIQIHASDLRLAAKIGNRAAQVTTIDNDLEVKDDAHTILSILSKLMNVNNGKSQVEINNCDRTRIAILTAQPRVSIGTNSNKEVRQPRRIVPGVQYVPTVIQQISKVNPQGTTMVVYRNKQSARYFLHVEDVGNDKARFVTPRGDTRLLSLSLFEKPEVIGEAYLLSEQLITMDQIKGNTETARASQRIGNAVEDSAQVSPQCFHSTNRMAQDDLVPYVISVLARHGGQANQTCIVEEIYEFFTKMFQEPFYQELTSTHVPRWKRYITEAKKMAKDRGLIKPAENSGRGYWELTPKGFALAKQGRK